MTESFATTVAAIAPVIWLVGAVEAHQVTKRMVDEKRQHAEQLSAAVAELEGADDATILSRPWSHQASVLRWHQLLLYLIWLALAVCLIFDTVRALSWLAGVRSPLGGSAFAGFAYMSIGFGMLVVTALPIVVSILRLSQSVSHGSGAYSALKMQREAAEGRASSSASAS